MNSKNKITFRPVYFLSLVFMFMAINLTSQSWIEPGQEWIFNKTSFNANFPTVDRWYYQADTLIDGNTFQKIKKQFKYVTGLMPGATPGLSMAFDDDEYVLTYFSGDTVFYHSVNFENFEVIPGPEDFEILYCFNAQAGDSWKVSDVIWDGEPLPGELPCDTSYVLVDSVGTVMMNGYSLRWLDVHTELPSTMGFNGRIVEGYGAVEQLIYPQGQPCTGTIDYAMYIPKCYTHPIYGLYNLSQQDCNAFLAVGINNLNLSSFTITPNPANEQFVINFNNSKSYSLSLLDLAGKVVKSIDVTNSDKVTIQSSDLKSGVYFLKVSDAESEPSFLKIIISH
jgi:hypothetical protein